MGMSVFIEMFTDLHDDRVCYFRVFSHYFSLALVGRPMGYDEFGINSSVNEDEGHTKFSVN